MTTPRRISNWIPMTDLRRSQMRRHNGPAVKGAVAENLRVAERTACVEVAQLLRLAGPLSIAQIAKRLAYPPATIELAVSTWRPTWFEQREDRVWFVCPEELNDE